MNRKILLTVMALALAIMFTGVAPTFAQVTYRLPHGSADGVTVIDIAGHQPPMQIIVVHYDGCGDELEVSIWVTISTPGGTISTWAPVAIVSDSPSVVAFWTNVWAGPHGMFPGIEGNIRLVKSWQLQVCRIGKNVLAYWTVPIAMLPPGCLLFKGYGCAQTENLVWNLPNKVTLEVDKVFFAAHATFVCPSWKYCGPVGLSTDTSMSTVNDVWAKAP